MTELIFLSIVIGLATFYGFMWKNNNESKKIQNLIKHVENKGIEFEGEVDAYLKGFADVRVLNNLIIPNGRKGGTTEIDLVILSTKGFYALECKNYAGFVMGKEDEKNWTISYKYNSYKKNISFYNPLKQNAGHILALKRMFPKYNFQSIVLFSDETGLAKNLFQRKDVMQFKGFKWYMENAFSKRSNTETQAVVDSIYEYLKSYENKNRDAHIEYVNSFKKNETA